MKKRSILLLLAGLLVCSAILSSCGKKEEGGSQGGQSSQEQSGSSGTSSSSSATVTGDVGADIGLTPGPQSACIKTNLGDIYVHLYPDRVPKTVENFIGLAEKGYYDGLTFHRVVEDLLIQGGDPKGDGTGGESLWGGEFADEFDDDLRNYTGALAMANRGSNTNGSQFFFVAAKELPDGFEEAMEKAGWPSATIERFKKFGGYPAWDGKHAVFGYVYEGMDVVRKISQVEADQNGAPKEKVVIETIEIFDTEK